MRRTRLLDNEIRVLKDENQRMGLELTGNKEKIKDNAEKIKLNRQLPYLVGNVVEILDQVPEARGPALHAAPVSPSHASSLPSLPSRTRRRTAARWTWTPPAAARRWC